MNYGRARDEERLRAALSAAESSARLAADALLDDLGTADGRVQAAVDVLRDYCRTCPDPFQALDVARLLRALVEDMDASVYANGPVIEWAHAEVRMQCLASRVARTLRDQGAVDIEQRVLELSMLHLKALEEGPRYAEILGAMVRVLDESEQRPPVRPVEEFFGLARRSNSAAFTGVAAPGAWKQPDEHAEDPHDQGAP